jgi:hypothetical protein
MSTGRTCFLSITSGNTRCFKRRYDYDRYHFAYMYAMHHAVSCMNVVTHQRSSKGGFCTDKEMARTSINLSSCRETFGRALPFCQPQKPSMSSHVRAPEVHLYCTESTSSSTTGAGRSSNGNPLFCNRQLECRPSPAW